MSGKLVRDKIPQIIADSGKTAQTRVLNDDEFKQELLLKLVEEAKELLEDPSFEERSDVEEVLRKIDSIFGFSSEKIEEVRLEKAEQRGGFDAQLYLEEVA